MEVSHSRSNAFAHLELLKISNVDVIALVQNFVTTTARAILLKDPAHSEIITPTISLGCPNDMLLMGSMNPVGAPQHKDTQWRATQAYDKKKYGLCHHRANIDINVCAYMRVSA